MEPISRRRLLAASGGAVLAGVLGSSAALALDAGPMPVPSPWARRYDVVINMGGAGATPPAAGPVSMDGTVYPVGAVDGGGNVMSGVRPLGTARVTGMLYDAARGRGAYMIILSVDGQGDVVLSGVLEGTRDDKVAVVGGTDRFNGVGGEAWIMWYNRAAGAMRATLNITTI